MNIKKDIWQTKLRIWYLKNKRNLPWRRKSDQNFYSIWLSEVMLQQTMVKTVIPYYLKFKNKWPNFKSFSNAELDEILLLWQGMGYYQRAQNLFKSLQILKRINLNKITYEKLITLPGIGNYSAASISAIFNNQNHVVVDVNIKRIISRAFGIDKQSKNFLKDLKIKAQYLTPKKDNKNYCQSMMDLGSLVCKSKNPLCNICPVCDLCDFAISSKKENVVKKKKRVQKYGITFYLKYRKNVFIQKNEEKLLNGLMQFPSSKYENYENNKDLNLLLKNKTKEWMKQNLPEIDFIEMGSINHNFSHFKLKLGIVKVLFNEKKKLSLAGSWIKEKSFKNYAFSKLMVKVIDEIK